MALSGYGLLIGKISASRPQRRGNPHWLLVVQPGDPDHPRYRVAVNLQTTVGRKAPELQYQTVDFNRRGTPAGNALIKELTRLAPTKYFLSASSTPDLPHLDFVRGGLIDPAKFTDLPARSKELQNEFRQAVADAKKAGTMVAVFGTGYPIDPGKGGSVPTGFTGIENLHMNQGARNLINGEPHYRENATEQDGGIIFLQPSGAKGFFVKFRTQTTATDLDGNPTDTGIKELDRTSEAVRSAIMPTRRARRMAARRAVQSISAPLGGAVPAAPKGKQHPVATPNGKGYVFADLDPNDASGKFNPDDDSKTFKTPYVMDRSKGAVRGPVPVPHVYPTMDLATVAGANPPGCVSNSSGKSIAFDIIGDSGAATDLALQSLEVKVTQLITQNAAISQPAFLYHVGDVVYYYGEENFYYGQFYEPFKAYPAPIFAIPGNHDGITYNDSMISLESFQSAFCAPTPDRWVGSGGIRRSAMTQPGVYFTLNAPLVSIIGLYSNCGESLGWLDEPQYLFLYQELVRLKKLRSGGLPAVILAIHHIPRWMPGEKDPTSTNIDAACKKAGFWPDAVISGHAHLYQRIVRQDTGQDIPYIITGAGGHALNPAQEVAKPYMAKLDARLGHVMYESGYVRATITSPAKGDPVLRFEYHSVKPATRGPDDLCQLNLRTSKLI